VLPGVLSELGFLAVFLSHPDESNIVEKTTAKNVERSIFIGLTTKVSDPDQLQQSTNYLHRPTPKRDGGSLQRSG
jgi:hypothetical protein